MTTPRLPAIALLGTGGTIASTAAQSSTVTDYEVTEGVRALLDAVPEIRPLAALEPMQVFNVDSRCITNAMLLELGQTVQAVLDKPDVEGAVITHGTDSLEETAYFLNLVLKSSKPVVLVGAMRPGSAISADGPLNLFNAVLLAAAPQSRGLGVMITLNGAVHAARYAAKRHTTDVQAFSSDEDGCLGHVHGGHVAIVRAPGHPHTLDTPFSMEALRNTAALPQVDILYDHQDAGPHLYEASIRAGSRGIVVAGMGNGSLSPQAEAGLAQASRQGIICVRATRTGAGPVSASRHDAKRGLVSAGTLNPQKARILLMLALARGDSRAQVQACFDRY